VPNATGSGSDQWAEVNQTRFKLAEYLCARPADADLKALCADALMAATPWNYYVQGDLKPHLREAWDHLRALVSPRRAPHVLALHLLIHLAEPQGGGQDRTLIGQLAADALDGMVRGSGHLDHMAAHIYQQVGRYAAGIRASRRAREDNDAYLKNCLVPYCMGHNLHLGIHNSVDAGQHRSAVDFAQRQLTAADEFARFGARDKSGGHSAVTPFSAALALVNLRFGLWKEAVAAVRRDGPCGKRCRDELQNTADSKVHRAVKQMVLGFAKEAAGESSDKEWSAISSLRWSDDEWSAVNKSTRLKVAWKAAGIELGARRAYTRGDTAVTIAALRNLTRDLGEYPYTEPDLWYYDPRACLGYVLLTRGRDGEPDPEGALEVYTEALAHRPRSPWALLGAAQAHGALVRSGGAAGRAGSHPGGPNPYDLQFRAAAADADVEIASSCPQYASGARAV